MHPVGERGPVIPASDNFPLMSQQLQLHLDDLITNLKKLREGQLSLKSASDVQDVHANLVLLKDVMSRIKVG